MNIFNFGKKLVWTLLIILALVGYGGSIEVYAKKDVTSELKKDSGIENICNNIEQFIGCIDDGYVKNITGGNIALTKKTKYNILGCCTIQDWIEGGEFIIGNHKFKKQYYNMFGTYPNIHKDRIKCDSVIYKNKKLYRQLSGEWGEVWPDFKIKKIYKVSNNKYEIIIRNGWINTFKQDFTYSNTKTIITIKKSKKSDYGYVIKKLRYDNKDEFKMIRYTACPKTVKFVTCYAKEIDDDYYNFYGKIDGRESFNIETVSPTVITDGEIVYYIYADVTWWAIRSYNTYTLKWDTLYTEYDLKGLPELIKLRNKKIFFKLDNKKYYVSLKNKKRHSVS